ncbi:unnamed protein product [Effrenium voratum]|uniref:Protein kinase domain-containing protein n=1 Tax=Effrenium voratum TaxID=2562239 RepID=A0AA36JA98_9DINO|nr:unnamed protein product [Effrenium voratum]CAJ1437143.1 unnamed protein product [Effrenium voratum]
MSIVCIACGHECVDESETDKHHEETGHHAFRQRVAEGYDDRAPRRMTCATCNFRCNNRAESWRHTQETGHSRFQSGEGSDDRTPCSMTCRTCRHVCANRAESWEHTEATGHTSFQHTVRVRASGNDTAEEEDSQVQKAIFESLLPDKSHEPAPNLRRSDGAVEQVKLQYILSCASDWKGKLSSGPQSFGDLYQAADGDLTFTVLRVQGSKIVKNMSPPAIEDLNKIAHNNIAMLQGYFLSPDLSTAMFIYHSENDGTLKQHLNDDKLAEMLSWPSRVTIANGIVTAIDYLHSLDPPCFHRSVKPGNILLDAERQPKLIACGLSRFVQCSSPKRKSALHVSQILFGDQGFMCPNYCKTCNFEKASEIFSVGATILQIVAGQTRFDSAPLSELPDDLKMADVEKLHDKRPPYASHEAEVRTLSNMTEQAMKRKQIRTSTIASLLEPVQDQTAPQGDDAQAVRDIRNAKWYEPYKLGVFNMVKAASRGDSKGKIHLVQIKPSLDNEYTMAEWPAIQQDLGSAYQRQKAPFYDGTTELISWKRILCQQWDLQDLRRFLEDYTRQHMHVIITSVSSGHMKEVEQVVDDVIRDPDGRGRVHTAFLQRGCDYSDVRRKKADG